MLEIISTGPFTMYTPDGFKAIFSYLKYYFSLTKENNFKVFKSNAYTCNSYTLWIVISEDHAKYPKRGTKLLLNIHTWNQYALSSKILYI